tara:strand:- start:2618 stop:3136 length:519 start_codon:yes stop_codon:yes gene_type:complete
MLYNAPAKGEDGLYFVKALNDSKRKCLVQLNGVKILDSSGDIAINLESEKNIAKIQAIDTENLGAAVENAETWFGKKLSEKVVEGAYTSSIADGQLTGERIEVMKVFNVEQGEEDFENVNPEKSCDVILEFAGLWFAKKSFGSSWNVVQVRVHPDPILDTYPDGFAFVDDEQ